MLEIENTDMKKQKNKIKTIEELQTRAYREAERELNQTPRPLTTQHLKDSVTDLLWTDHYYATEYPESSHRLIDIETIIRNEPEILKNDVPEKYNMIENGTIKTGKVIKEIITQKIHEAIQNFIDHEEPLLVDPRETLIKIVQGRTVKELIDNALQEDRGFRNIYEEIVLENVEIPRDDLSCMLFRGSGYLRTNGNDLQIEFGIARERNPEGKFYWKDADLEVALDLYI